MGRKAHEDWYKDQREKAKELQKHRWSEDLHCELCGLHLTGVQSRKFCEAKELASCLICGRKTWATAEVGKPCNMSQPDGSRCEGAMSSPSPSDGGQEWDQTERCEVCNSELSQCGPQGIDGEPSLDCQVCKLRELLAAEREALDEFKQFHHNPIVAQLNSDLAAERRKREQAENIQHAEKQILLDEIAINAQLREQLATAERDALTPIAQTLDDDDVFTDSELGVSVIRSEELKQLRKQLDAALNGWAREVQRADDAEAACGENCKTIARLTKELATAMDALIEIANDRSAGPIRGIARAALAKMGEKLRLIGPY